MFTQVSTWIIVSWIWATAPLHGLDGNPQIVNQTSDDITLLNAQVLNRTVGSSVNLNRCDRVSATNRNVTYDCRNAIQQRFGMPLIQMRAYVRVVENRTSTGLSTMQPVEGHDTPLILLRVIAREKAYRTSGSMGFYITNPSGVLYFDRSQVRSESRLVLKDGTYGIPITFLALFPRSERSPPLTRSLGFKPFIDFHVPAEGRIIRNWDIEPREGYDNYLLLQGYSPPLRDILSIERSSTVLWKGVTP